MNSHEISLWIDERWYKALEQHLPEGSIEKSLNSYLDQLIGQLPESVRDKINREIELEDQMNLAQKEAARRFAVFHIREDGKEQYLQVERELEFLDVARLLRSYMRREHGVDSFTQRLKAPQEISAIDFRKLVQLRLENTGRVTGAFELDFDQQQLSTLNTMDGWVVFNMKDVSKAVYRADQKVQASSEERWVRFLDALSGKELTSGSLPMPLSGSRRLLPEEISFSEEISEMDSLLNFYVPVCFDPDEVFGTYVSTEDNDDYVNVYANYDLKSGEVHDNLDVVLYHGDDVFEYLYLLTAAEKEIIMQKMNAYCFETAGISLSEWREEYLEQEVKSDMQMQGMG